MASLRMESFITRGLACAACSSAFGAVPSSPESSNRPNIVVILADDLGNGDIGAYGCTDIPTPNIDSIARNGVLCEAGYVTAPQCGPSRAGLMTGRYQQRFGFELNPSSKQRAECGLSLNEELIFSRMRKAGYKTGIVGKWHLGVSEKYRPLERGADYFYGVLDGTSLYVPPFDWAAKHYQSGEPTDIYRNDRLYIEKNADYITDAFARECVGFIESNSAHPFYLYASFTAPHVPIQYRQKDIERLAHIQDAARRKYAALVVTLDDAVGEILSALDRQGLREKTLVVFLSDNGASKEGGGSNAPYRGGKGSLWEGGIRIPFVVQWPSVIPPGRIFSHPVLSLDITATAAELAGAAAGGGLPMDGVNLMPYLTGASTNSPHEFLFWRIFAWSRAFAIRSGDWKLVSTEADKVSLYNLKSDPKEEKNVSSQYPEIAASLKTRWEKWQTGTVDPAWAWTRKDE